jgi:glutamate 5-kinase
LLELGCVPVVNENDAIASDEIRFGDNDRIAALVANLLGADLLVLLTDIAGLYSADPRLDPTAVLVEDVQEIDTGLEATVGGAGTARGSGGMASKLQAAKIATWSGIDTVIARADRPEVLVEAVAGVRGVGTRFHRSARRLPARKLWIAFATDPAGRILVDAGARTALLERGVSLLPAGVVAVEGTFDAMDPVELAGPDGKAFARGLVSMDDALLRAVAGKRTAELGDGVPHEVVHRDDLVPTPL